MTTGRKPWPLTNNEPNSHAAPKKNTPENPNTVEGWRSTNLTFSMTPINPDLDIHPTNRYELAQHPTNPIHTTLHRLDGTTIYTIDNIGLDKQHDIYNYTPNNPPFEDSLAKLIHRNNNISTQRIFKEPILRWLVVGSRGYKPMLHVDQPTSTYMAYDDRGYANYISITTGTLENLHI